MKKKFNYLVFPVLGVVLFATMFFLSKNVSAQKKIIKGIVPTIDYHSEDPSLDPSIEKNIKNVIMTVYPKETRDFNPNAMKHITVKIDTSYNGVAYTSNGHVTISSAWLHKKPKDLDLVTHEVMHIVQAYPNGAGPIWLTEGIADYARYKYGLDNKGAGWSLTPFSQKQSYKNSYRISARFLVWITQNYDRDFVKKMDQHLRGNTYLPKLWKKYTGNNVDQLWNEYAKNPEIS